MTPMTMLTHARRLAALSLFPVAAATLPNCSLDRSFTFPATAGYRLMVSASIRNADGEDFYVTSRDAVFAGGMAATLVFGVPAGGDVTTMPHQWKLYLSRRFQQGPMSPEFAAHFGRGPYCVRQTEVVSSHERFMGTPVSEDEGWGEPMMCPDEPAMGPCAGSGHPGLHFMPESAALAFASTPVGATAGRLPLTIENRSSDRLCLDAPRLSPSSADPGDFVLDVGDCRPLTGPEMMLGVAILSSGTRTSCTLFVDFGPTNPGSRSARLLVASNYALPHQPVFLSGTGEAGALTVGPSPLCLNVPTEVIDGMICRRRPLDLSNAGPGVVTVTSMSLGTGADNWHLDLSPDLALPFTVRPGRAVTVTVRECGTAPMDSTFLTVNSNATQPSLMVPMAGPTTGCTP
jgi:hypothetical protein